MFVFYLYISGGAFSSNVSLKIMPESPEGVYQRALGKSSGK